MNSHRTRLNIADRLLQVVEERDQALRDAGELREENQRLTLAVFILENRGKHCEIPAGAPIRFYEKRNGSWQWGKRHQYKRTLEGRVEDVEDCRATILVYFDDDQEGSASVDIEDVRICR